MKPFVLIARTISPMAIHENPTILDSIGRLSHRYTHTAAAITGIIRYLTTAAPDLSLSFTQNLTITQILVNMKPRIAPKLTKDMAFIRLSWNIIAVSPMAAVSNMFFDGVLNLGCT